jgi:hypothetical protein
MAVTITATLVSSTDPKPVQIVLNGITAGLAYMVTGSAGGTTWVPSGGTGVSLGAQIVLTDVRTPLNAPITYTVVASGVTTSASPVTVPFGARYVLQSLDGLTVLPFAWMDNDLPRDFAVNAATFDVPGRSRPVVRYAVGGDGGGAYVVRTTKANTAVLQQMLRSGRPVVLRTDGSVRDLPAVDMFLITRVANMARRAFVAAGTLSTDRDWTLEYTLVDDPQPSRGTSAFTWDSFDAAMANRSWSNLVSNPTFDTNTTGWAAAGTAVPTLAWQSTGGSASPGFARLTSTGTTAMSLNASATFAVTAGDLFAVQAMLRGTVGRFAHIRLTWTGASATQATAVALTSTTVWQQYTYTGTVPAGATAVRVDLLVDATIASGNVLDVDAVQYTPGTNTVRPFPQDFDSIFAGLTWDLFDTYDWSQLA